MLILSKKRREENKRASLDSIQFPVLDIASPSPSERSIDDCSDDSPFLRERLSSLGLGIKTVEKDGNCLFSAVSDQLYGTPEFHRDLREAVCGFLQSHEEEYSSFVEEEDFQSYISNMRKMGTWAGNLELHAISILYNVNVRIYCEDETFVDIVNFEGSEAKWIYLTYQHGEHYGSVRDATDLQGSGNSSLKEVVEPSPLHTSDPLVQNMSRNHQLSPKQVADWITVFKGNVELTNKWLKISNEAQSSKSDNRAHLKGLSGKPYHVRTLSNIFRSSKNKKGVNRKDGSYLPYR
ncbi:hypothetical protein GAYE_SCF37G5181 [Galdieria yellowstonensis]|uniref:OTU domain-containing protein n=1 Tax=Galdieria yellowstonensis TaxID=3028027 RepID=A0AAV9IIN3_9RHOD|nr:hypothetical protein GAYE_SCF37G5181 [Galdieria yellowstonensis]